MSKSGKVILALCFISTFLLALSCYIYSTSIGLLNRNPKMLYLDPCKQPEKGLVFNWSFDQVDGVHTDDSSGNGIPGRMGSLFDNHRLFFKIPTRFRSFALPRQVEGVNGKSLLFNGRNWVSAGNCKCFASDTFSLSMWIWRTKTRPAVKGDWFVPTLAAKSSWPGTGWWLCTQPNTANLDMAVSWGSERRHIHSGFEIPPEEWHHVAVTMDNVRHEIGFFIDGKRFGEAHTGVPAWLTNWDQELYVGDYDGTGRWPWLGKIDNVQFHTGILSQEQVREIYAHDLPGKNL
jgi:hypothetical protein